jgi:hypothetical protein
MKRFTLVFGSVGLVGLVCLATVPAACVTSTNPGAPDEDSGALPGEDAGTPGTDATAPGNDSGPADSGADVALDSGDAAPAPLTLTVLLAGAPESGVLVVFQDAAGAVVSTATTDAAGSVSQLVVAGSQVTVFLGTASSPNLVTVQDVAPGDALTLVDYGASTGESYLESVNVTLPAPTWDAATTGEEVYAASCQQADQYALDLQSYCVSQGQFPLLAVAADYETNPEQEIAYTYQLGNPVVPDAGLPTDGGNPQFAIARPWSTSSVTDTVTTSTLPLLPSDGGLNFQSLSLDYWEGAEGLAVPMVSGNVYSLPSDGGEPSSTFVVHTGFPDFVQTTAYASLNTPNESSDVFVTTRGAPPAASQTSALALGTLPALTGATINPDDAGTLQQPIVTWTSAGSLAAANGIFVQVQFSGSYSDGGYVAGTWSIVAPPNVTSVSAPSLPPSAPVAVPANASYGPPRVVAVQASFLAGYSAFKAQFAAIPVFTGNWSPSVPLLPVDGTLYVSVLYPNEG